LFCEALAAINGPVIAGVERNLCFAAAVSAGSDKGFLASGCAFLRIAARFTALWLVHEAFLGVELLFACRENEVCSAILALKGFVVEHFCVTSHILKFDLGRTYTDTFVKQRSEIKLLGHMFEFCAGAGE
jgi:hypothetical protein